MKRSAVVVEALAVLAGCGGGGGTGTGGGSGGGSGGGGGGGQTLDCPGLVSCTSNCTNMDQTCLNACGAQTTNAVIDVYNALVACTNAHSCSTSECVQQNCATELNACVGATGTGGGAGGGGGASAVFTEGAACSLSGSLGHCTWTVSNVWDPATTTLTATVGTMWSVP